MAGPSARTTSTARPIARSAVPFGYRRLPADHERQLLLAVLDRAHVRPDRDRARVPPAGALRESRMRWRRNPKGTAERAIGLAVLVVLALGPAIFNDYWVNTIL